MFWRKIIDYFLDDIHQKLFLWQGKTTLYEAQVKTQKWADKWIENEKKSLLTCFQKIANFKVTS